MEGNDSFSMNRYFVEKKVGSGTCTYLYGAHSSSWECLPGS